MKGRIAYLPVDVEANAKFMPENLLNIDSLCPRRMAAYKGM